jgi:hypothetical protein
MEDRMKEQGTLDRREFTRAAVLAALSGVTITISACGGGGGGSSPSAPSNPNPSLGPGDKAGSIGANHGHSAVITAAQLTAGAAVNLELTVGSGHTHTVNLSAAEVTQIAGGTRVSKTSTTDDAHNHTVTFN